MDKLRMTIVKNGKTLTYYYTVNSFDNKRGHFTDIYRDESGKLYEIDRIQNGIVFPSYPRNTASGSMISFGTNFLQLLLGIDSKADEKETDKLVRKAEYSLQKAHEYYEKSNASTCDKDLSNAISDKIDEILGQFYKLPRMTTEENMLSTLTHIERIQNNSILNNVLNDKLESLSEQDKDL
jgi:hypothetical protein